MTPFSTLCQKLKENDPYITHLVKCYGLNGDSVQALSESLVENTVAKQLHLINTQTLGGKGLHELARLLEHNGTLQELYICTSFTNKTSVVVDEAVHDKGRQVRLDCDKFQTLDKKTYGSSHVLFTGLANNTSIHNLQLSHKNISNDDAKAIGSMLIVNKSIKEISLTHNNISNRGIEYICSGLEKNRSVQTLDLSGNPFSHRGAIAMHNMLKNNTTLKEIRMVLGNSSSSAPNDETKKILLDAAVQNLFVGAYYVNDSELQKKLFFFGKLNSMYHRQILRKDNLPDGLWAYILSRCTKKKWRYYPSKSPFGKNDVLFQFIKSKPELFIRERNYVHH